MTNLGRVMQYVLKKQREYFKENAHQFFTGTDVVRMVPSVKVCVEATIAAMGGEPFMNIVAEEMDWESSD